MCDIERIEIDDRYLVKDKSTSDGSQVKYFVDGKWFKVDYHGGEAESEELSSIVLECTNLDSSQYTKYRKIYINDYLGCVSDDFRGDCSSEEFVTLYRLYKNITGRDLAVVTSRMDYYDAIEYVVEFVYRETSLDIRGYLANIFWLDRIILNTDRHFNNIGIIMMADGYKIAPIFDNGKSLLTGCTTDIDEMATRVAVKKVYSKTFSPDFQMNYLYLKDCTKIQLDVEQLMRRVSERTKSRQKEVLLYQLERCALNSD